MAFRISDALRREAPYIVIDEDRSAQNLMVPCYMSSADVRSLAALLAGSGMELLIAQADRIVRLCQHQPHALSVPEYRNGLHAYYEKMAGMIPKKSGESDVGK